MSTKNGSFAKNIISLSLAVLILFGIVAGVWIYLDRTNGGTDTFKTFTLELDGHRIKTEKTSTKLSPGKHTASVGYLFEDITGDNYGFDVHFKPKEYVKFDYTVNGGAYPWSDLETLDEAFSLDKQEDGFTYTVPEGLGTVLGKLHEGRITCPAELPNDGYIYTLVVSSYNEKVVYTIDFTISGPNLDIQPGGIIF